MTRPRPRVRPARRRRALASRRPRLLAEHRADAAAARAGEPSDLEALQARAVADPACVLGRGRRRPRARVAAAVVVGAGPGGRHRACRAGGAAGRSTTRRRCSRRWSAAGAARRRGAWPGRATTGRCGASPAPSSSRRSRRAADRFAAHGIGEGTRVGVFLPMLPETVDHGPRAGPAPGGVHAAVLRVRGARRGGAAAGVRGHAPRHRGRRSCGAAAVVADGSRWRGRPSRRRRRCAACSWCERLGGGAATSAGLADRARGAPWDALPTPDAVGGRRRPSPARTATSTPRRRTWSSTRRGRPARRRARSTSTAGSRSRRRRTSPTRSTCGRATRCAGSPTSAG